MNYLKHPHVNRNIKTEEDDWCWPDEVLGLDVLIYYGSIEDTIKRANMWLQQSGQTAKSFYYAFNKFTVYTKV